MHTGSPIKSTGDVALTPYYELNGYKAWGATAKMIRELLTLIHDDLPGTEHLLIRLLK